MSLLLLIPLSIGLGLMGLCAFYWALKNGQFDDPDGPHGASSPLISHSKWKESPMTSWLPTLKTATPEEGYDLAVKLARVAVKLTQPDAEIRDRLQPEYAEDSDALIAVSQVVATHFATVAVANDYWRGTT
ncbi:cbb3-type cytochrome oxidase assembly protein CcoS [Roseovarius sp.]|uniref:cbb3-type cytochrome oxidase assembly protein CcoS n=1 Tax=Roseovarius sp. TaxID=1486281 RepID=UPI003A97E817